MSDSELLKKINLTKVVLPLLHTKMKTNNSEFKLSKVYNEINDTTNDIINSLLDNKKIKKENITFYKKELLELLSICASYEYLYNKNTCLDDLKETLLELLMNTEFLKNDGIEEIKIIPIQKVFYEINKFHSLLYFSGYISHEVVKELNKNILININKIVINLIDYLKTKNFNDTNYIYEVIKIASTVYTDIIEVLFINLSKTEKKLKEYVEKQSIYIKKIEELFIEQYSLLNTSCNKLQEYIEK
jgi:hypothetical protein